MLCCGGGTSPEELWRFAVRGERGGMAVARRAGRLAVAEERARGSMEAARRACSLSQLSWHEEVSWEEVHAQCEALAIASRSQDSRLKHTLQGLRLRIVPPAMLNSHAERDEKRWGRDVGFESESGVILLSTDAQVV